MKKLTLLFALLLILAACTPAAENPTATASPAPSDTLVATEAASQIATLTPTVVKPTIQPTVTREPTLTATPEQLGGDEVGVACYYMDGVSSTHIPPPEIAPLLVPTSPEKWQELMNLTDSTGKPIQWGKPAFFVNWEGGPGDGIFPVIPFLLRDIVQYGIYKGDNVLTYLAIFETPAKGGSNFYILQLTPRGRYVNPTSGYTAYPSTGLPAEWVGQNVPTQTAFLGGVWQSDTQLLELFQGYIGKVVLVEFPDLSGPVGSVPQYEKSVTWMSDAELIPEGFEANTGTPNFFLPAKP